MAQQAFKISRLSDAQIGKALTILAKDFGPFVVGIQALTYSIGQISFPTEFEELWDKLINLNSDLIDHFSVTVGGVYILYYRGGMNGLTHEKSPVFDDLLLDAKSGEPDKLEIAARILTIFRPIQLQRATDANDLLEAQRAIQESTFSRLQHQLEQLFQQTLDVRTQLDESIRTKEIKLQEIYDEKLRVSDGELVAQRAKLLKESGDLEERRKALDDSDNTFARRQIRDRMLSDVSERVHNFSVSEATLKSRSPVARGMFILMLILITIFIWTAIEISQARNQSAAMKMNMTATEDVRKSNHYNPVVANSLLYNYSSTSTPNTINTNTNEIIALWIRLSIASFGLVASLIYYIRWTNQWATQFSTTEQSLKQFHIDVNRANWVVETCLEWRKENQSDIPANLVESLTRGLFAGRDQLSQVLHPADELASALMGSASKLSLDLNGNKVEINKPNKIPKTLEI